MIREYLRLALFAIGLLTGVQVPAFVDQYEKRIDAQLSEARLGMQGFQDTADQFFDGDLQKLLAHYQTSDDAVFKTDASNLAFLFSRVDLLQEHAQALRQAGWFKPFFLFWQRDAATLQATTEQFSYMVPLTPEALLWGLLLALIAAALIDTGCWCGKKSVVYMVKSKAHK